MPSGPRASGSGRSRPAANAEPTHVSPRTPAGTLLRRYWHPLGLAGEVGGRPRPVTVLGEDPILFRDGQGRPGLALTATLSTAPSRSAGAGGGEGVRIPSTPPPDSRGAAGKGERVRVRG